MDVPFSYTHFLPRQLTPAHTCFLYSRACPTSFPSLSVPSWWLALAPGNRPYFDGGLDQDLVAIFEWLTRKRAAMARRAERQIGVKGGRGEGLE